MKFSELSEPKKQTWHELLLWVNGPLITAWDSQLPPQQAQGGKDANQVSAAAVFAVCSTLPHWEGSGASICHIRGRHGWPTSSM